MRSKRSKAWHLRSDIRKAREIIEQGLPAPKQKRLGIRRVDPLGGYVAFVHPSLEADLRGLKK